MAETPKPKRKYTRRQKQQAMPAAYSVIVTVKTGRAVDTIYAEDATVVGSCLVVRSYDGPPPLFLRTRYIPLGIGEVQVCRRPEVSTHSYAPASMQQMTMTPTAAPTGPVIEAGPLGRMRDAIDRGARPPSDNGPFVERNTEGVPVVSVGSFDERPF